MTNLPEGIVSNEDVARTDEFIAELVSNVNSRDRLAQYLEKNEPVLAKWMKVTSTNTANSLFRDLSSLENASQLGLIITHIKLEAFLLAYQAFSKFWASQLVVDTDSGTTISDVEEFQNWKTGILPDKYYSFDPGEDPVLQEVKKNHEMHKQFILDIKKMKDLTSTKKKYKRRTSQLPSTDLSSQMESEKSDS